MNHSRPDVLVVGGGLIGMLSARELALAGAAVTIVERGTVGRESSWAGGGILSPLYPWRFADGVTTLAQWSQERYPGLCNSLAEATGIDPEWTRSGLLILGPEDVAAARNWAVRFGYSMEDVDSRQAREHEPRLGADESGVWLPQVAQVRNPRLLKALRVALEQLGVRFVEQCEVSGFVARDGRCVGVNVTHEQLHAGQVLVAGGAWSGKLLDGLGAALPVQPVRGQMILYRAPAGLVQRIVLSEDRYVIPRRDGRVLVGSTLEYTGFDKLTTETALCDLRGVAGRLVPALTDYPVEHHWAGLRPGSPDGVPFIGEHPLARGLFINAGHFRNGVVMGYASAHLVADLMLDRDPCVDPAAYRVSPA